MKSIARITSVRFRNYKALREYQINLTDRNFLVGPNNAGKSTIISAFRMLSVALRRTSGRKLDIVKGPKGRSYGVVVPAEALPVSIENVHTDYAEEDTTITFRISNGNELQLFFPTDGSCLFIADAQGRPLTTASAFKNAFPIVLAVIPVLAPVDHLEKKVLEDTVYKNITTHRASGNFRSYWYYNEEDFDEFAEDVRRTWPGMEIQKPSVVNHATGELMMFCHENRYPRELFWIGSGFQIWCQLLTHLMRAREASLVVIDEPEIYLHADVQRQLVGLVRQFEADVLIATHSTEIMGEAEPREMVLIDKRNKTAERLKNAERLQAALSGVGSVHSIPLSQLARSRRIVFFEGDTDFKTIRLFAKLLGFEGIASGLDIYPAKSEGFGSWKKVAHLGWGISKALGNALNVGAVFDRDFFPDGEVAEVKAELTKELKFAHIHDRKELENYLLVPAAIERAVTSAIRDKAKRDESSMPKIPDVRQLLREITDEYRVDVFSQRTSREVEYQKPRSPGISPTTLNSEAIKKFEDSWSSLEGRLVVVSGKLVLQALRDRILETYGVSLSNARIMGGMREFEVPDDFKELLRKLDEFRLQSVS
jgi:energy-coupling factor transporter ATP-binding protein EcfA2